MANSIVSPGRGPATLPEFLEEAASRYGPAPALLFKSTYRYRQWSYEDLWRDSGNVAALLQGRGVKPGDRALIWGPNCPQWVIAFFGCLRASVIVVPLDLRGSAEFAERVVASSRPAVAFVSRATPHRGTGIGVPTIDFEELDRNLDGMDGEAADARNGERKPERVPVGESDIAEIMYTSGTTGTPKGVMITHRNLLSNVASSSVPIPGKRSYRLVSILPLSHMFEQMASLLSALNSGGNITYPASIQPTVLIRTMQERRVTTLLLVPQLLDLLMKRIEAEVQRRGKGRQWRLMHRFAGYLPRPVRRVMFRRVLARFGGSLDFIVSGGAALDPALGARWNNLGVKIIQGYGTTETSPAVSTHNLSGPRFDSVGRPLPGVEVRIADDGEILVRGPNVTPGYWEAPQATQTVFVDGWYRTGDQGHIDRQGCLHIRGRKKDMVVLANGMNVYPEDVESVLRQYPGVADAVVVGLPRSAEAEVHAVFPRQCADRAEAAVAWANERLAEHQRIRGYSIWQEDEFPRTHTLKIKKTVMVDSILGKTPRDAAAIQRSRVVVGAGARDVAQIVADIATMDRRKLRLDATLGADLGMDSLKRVELLAVIEDELGAYLDESEVGPDTTVAQVAALVGRAAKASPRMRFPTWGMASWCRPIRGVLQRVAVFPLLRAAYRLRVRGSGHLASISGPVIFAANHGHHLDNGLILKAMPSRTRRRVAIAGAAEYWRNPFWAIANPLLGNGFPFARDGAVRPSLENMGRILDRGWSVMIYPEGRVTVGNDVQEFKSGAGLLAVDGRIPVVPVRVRIERMGWPARFPLLRRGSVRVSFGAPITFEPGTPYEVATSRLREAVVAL